MNELGMLTGECHLSTINNGDKTLSSFTSTSNFEIKYNDIINMVEFKCPLNLNRCKAFLNLEDSYISSFVDWEDNNNDNVPDLVRSYKNFIKKFTKDTKINYSGTKNHRLYASGMCISYFPAELRNFLTNNCYDYDMTCCFPTILLKITKDTGLPYKYLEKYVEEKDNFIEKNGINGKYIHKLMNIDKPCLDNEPKDINNLILEILLNKEKIIENYSEKIKKEKTDSQNPISSQFNSIIMFHENLLLSRVLNYFTHDLHTSGCIPLYDGFITPLKINIETLNEITKDFNIKWKIKNNESKLFNLLNLENSLDIANIFIELYKNLIIKIRPDSNTKNPIVYVYHDNKWCATDPRAAIKNIIKEKLIPYIDEYFSNVNIKYLRKIGLDEDTRLEKHKKISKEYFKCIKDLQNKSSSDKIAAEIIDYIPYSYNIEFDNYPDYLPFDNCILNLKDNTTIPYSPEFLITKTVGYSYTRKNKTKYKEIDELIKKIFPQKDERELVLHKLAHSLNGHNHARFVILQGEGGNGKSVILNMMNTTLGKFAYNIGNAICVSAKKTGSGPNVELAKLDLARFIWCSEPSCGDKFDYDRIKEITGDGELNARTLFSEKTKTKISGDLWIACNDDIPLNLTSDGHNVRRRIIEIEMKSIFSDKPDTNVPNSYKADIKYTQQDTYHSLKMDLIHYLMPYSKNLYDEKRNRKIDDLIPKHITELGLKYITKSNTFKVWFNSISEKTDNSEEYIQTNDLYAKYKCSDDYINLTKKQRREITYSSFMDKFRKDPDTKLYYRDKIDIKKADGTPTCARSIILYYKLKKSTDEDFITDEDKLSSSSTN